MNRKALILVFLSASIAAPVYADNACETVICMFGEVTGNSGGSKCRSAIRDYFDIRKYDWKGFSPSRTASARGDFLDQCGSADSSSKKRINNKFGRQFGF